MKIVHLIWSFTVGGAELLLVDIVNEQIKYEKIHLIVVNRLIDKNLLDKISDKVKVYLVNRKPGSRNILHILKLNYFLRKVNPDIIHCHSYDLIRIIFYRKPKIVLTVHNVTTPPENLSKYDKIFSISKSVQKDILNKSDVKSEVIYNGINFNLISKNENYKYKKFRIVQIGRLEHQIKGQHILIKALYHLVHKFKLDNVELDLIGEGKSSGFLNDLVNELNLKKHVNFLGMKSRSFIYENLKNYNLLAQPSFFEGFGLSVIEAMAAGVPVLVASVDGLLETVQNGKYGYFFKVNDPLDCAEKIIAIQKEIGTENFKSKMNGAYKFVVSNFLIENNTRRYVEEYINLLEA